MYLKDEKKSLENISLSSWNDVPKPRIFHVPVGPTFGTYRLLFAPTVLCFISLLGYGFLLHIYLLQYYILYIRTLFFNFNTTIKFDSLKSKWRLWFDIIENFGLQVHQKYNYVSNS
jgi:hypothetical protein